MNPQVSIILPCYNGGQYISVAIKSVMRQTAQNWELLVIDDGSTDDSSKIANQFCISDKRIKYFHHDNIGLAKTLNTGIRLSKGEFIARIDCDDVWNDREKLEKQLKIMYANKNVNLVGTSFYVFNDASKFRRQINVSCSDSRHALKLLLSKSRFFPHSSILFRKKVGEHCVFYREDIRLAEDFDLYLRMCTVGEVVCIATPSTSVRSHPGQISHHDAGVSQLLDSLIAIKSFHLSMHGESEPFLGGVVFNRAEFKELISLSHFFVYCSLALGGKINVLTTLFLHPLLTFFYLFKRKVLIDKILKK